ncbi:OLC1v1005282C1 [Oldenlandia corymbosa var. corymbosa]|uniref:OLC1v1005282C1 n=1 Tax=Oldenlandia corymbosa var. corymbosa TaxID=529605 RepID=A0AAV1DHQ0_OLDCO|nr:OLC1v1005282C1 [Oldenlandia corymbosa var. corymbosa]
MAPPKKDATTKGTQQPTPQQEEESQETSTLSTLASQIQLLVTQVGNIGKEIDIKISQAEFAQKQDTLAERQERMGAQMTNLKGEHGTLTSNFATFQEQMQNVQDEVRSIIRQPHPPPPPPFRPVRPNSPPVELSTEDERSEPPSPPRRIRPRRRDDEPEKGKLKHDLPEFFGTSEPDKYLEWEMNVDKVFNMHYYAEDYKVNAAISQFRLNANTWWLDVNRRRRRDGDPEIVTWLQLKRLMRQNFVRKSYQKQLRNELQDLRQGSRTVWDFYWELVSLRTKLQLDESDESMEARFIRGLNHNLRDPVELHALKVQSLEQLVEYADTLEKQTKTRESRAVPTSSRPYSGSTSTKPSPQSSQMRPAPARTPFQPRRPPTTSTGFPPKPVAKAPPPKVWFAGK